jgi:DnaA family protein
MTQLLLDLEPPPRPTLDNFMVGRNAEAIAALRRLVSTPTQDPSGRFLYLWGEAGSGRSHLLRAACDLTTGRYLEGSDLSASSLANDDTAAMLAVDDVESTDAATQEALFHAFNRLRDDPRGTLVVAGNAAPRDLKLDADRDDLRSRLAWGLVYQLHRLDDDEKDAALERHASQRGFPLVPEVRRYLLTHFSRDLGSLMQMVDALDRHARESKRIVTVPLIREYLQRNLAFPTRDRPIDQFA